MEMPVFSEEEATLMDYVNVLLKRKWLIIIPTFFCVVLAAVISFLLPKKWEVDAMIVPSKFLIQTEQGQFEEVLISEPQQIVSQINQNAYGNKIAVELGLDIRKFPKLKAEHIRDTKLVRVYTREKDVKKAQQVLNSLFNDLKKDLDTKIKVEIAGLDTQAESKKNTIKTKEIEIKNKKNTIDLRKIQIQDKKNEIKTKQNRINDKENEIKTKDNAIKLKNNEIKSKNLNIESEEIEKTRVEEEIKTLNNKLTISEEREEAITLEMKDVKDRINRIEEEQKKVLNKESKKNALAILLYSNEIQNNLRYYNTLDEKLTNERITQENINLDIEDKKKEIKLIDNQIEQIKTQISDIETEINNIDTQIDDIHTQIDDIKTQIDDINNEIGKINNEIDTVNNEIAIKHTEISNLENEITLIEERKGRIDYAQIVKEPTVSIFPVFPNKKLLIIIAIILGLFIFTTITLIYDYIERQKRS